MSNAPYLLAGARQGLRCGQAPLADALDRDGLVCGIDGISMGAATERYQAGLGISREDQDIFAAESHARAAAAIKAGRLATEIVRVTVTSRQGDVLVEDDEGVRPGTTAGRLAALQPAFSPHGTITAGSASQLSDGGCAAVVMSKDRAGQLGLPWLAELGSYGTDPRPGTAPPRRRNRGRRALRRRRPGRRPHHPRPRHLGPRRRAGLLLLVLVLEREPELGAEGDPAFLTDLQVLLDHFGDAQVPQRLKCGVYGG